MKIVILAGGSGTRLWPLSRQDYPKQFIKINSEFSFFQGTVLRLLKKYQAQDIMISSQRQYKFHIISDLLKILPQDKMPHLIFEPQSKNTFGALLAVLNYSLQKLKLSREDIITLLPSDHIISPDDKFQDYLDLAQKAALQDYIVVLGIEPKNNNSGYGYIRTSKNMDIGLKVESFIEKPSESVIKKLLSARNCFWNAGIFSFKVKTMLDEIGKNMPQAVPFLEMEWEKFLESFKKLPSISIDNAIMEKTGRAVLIPLKDLYWNDIGSFESLYEILDKDKAGNVLIGNILAPDTANSFLLSNKRLISALGVEDLLVIDTADALLIASKTKSQKVKELVQKLKEENSKEVLEHLTHYMPWGSFTILEQGPLYKIKHVIVNPKERLSLQLHRKRTEHWIIIKGKAKIRIGEEEKYISKNESAYVPKATLHRLENPASSELELIEVQNGEYLGEDDIERLEDKYKDMR